jgi:hypothetical protein
MFKSNAYLELTRGQQAILMYQILYGHSKYGIDEFFGSLSYAMANEAFWEQLVNGMRHLGDNAIAGLIEDMHKLYPNYRFSNFKEEKVRINRSLKTLLPETTKLAAQYIRSHVEEFVETDWLIFHE